VVLSNKVAFRIPWTPALRGELASRFHEVRASRGLLIYAADRSSFASK
jgi:hypothetical protein